MLIKDAFHEDRFKGVVYYFESNGFSSVFELQNFDFDLLYFVPGLAEDIVAETKELCQKVWLHEEDFATANEESEMVAIENCSIEETATDIKPDELGEVLESIVLQIKRIEYAFPSKESLQKRANELVELADIESEEFIKILCKELCEKADKAGFSEEEIDVLKSISISDFFADVTMGTRRCGGSLIHHCLKEGKQTLWDLRDFVFDSSKIRGASEASMLVCKNAYKQLVKDVKAGKLRKVEPCKEDHIREFVDKWSSLNENMRVCAINGGRGKTLQYTADELGITRERVRQISLKASRILRLSAKLLVDELLASNGGKFTEEDVFSCFDDEETGIAFLFAIRESDDCRYVKFAGKYCSCDLPKDYERLLWNIAERYIGDGANFTEHMEEIEATILRAGMAQLDAFDFLSYLLCSGYKLYGDFVARGRSAYTLICYDVIRRHFPNGIKLEATGDCQDLSRLRDIVRLSYGNYELPDNNRALVARITPMLVLCGRSTYCVADNLQYSLDLLDDIVAYVNESAEPFVFYDTLFKHFQGRLLMETTIDNYHCLHGVMKMLYPHDFQYDRDGLTKIGATRISLDQKITEVLLSAGRPMNREEIYQACPYAVGLRLANAASRDPGIIQWAYNEYNHIDNIKVDSSQKAALEKVLKDLTDSNRGYCNERQLLSAVTSALPEFVKENKITDGLNLFYILECYFKSQFRFSRPHIVSKQFPEDIPLTNICIGKYFIGQRDSFSYADFTSIAQRGGWSSSMASAILIGLEAEYIRLNETEYLLKDKFMLDENQIKDIETAVFTAMNGEPYVALFAAFANDTYPSIGYPWNEFVLDSIIRNFIPSLKIIEPIMRDRRYKRGIIVRSDNPCETYEDLVISVLVKDDFEETPLDLFDDYLRTAGLLLNNVPQEILDSPGLIIKDGVVRLA